MNECEELEDWLDGEGVEIFQQRLTFSNPETKSAAVELATGEYGIFYDPERVDTGAERYAVMLHEAGHYATGCTHAVGSPLDLVARHEYRADKWAVRRFCRTHDIPAALRAGYTDPHDLADMWGITEAFVISAVGFAMTGVFTRPAVKTA